MRAVTKLTIILLVTMIIILTLASCAGATGPQGPIGPQGSEGSPGVSGVSVTDASITDAGHLVLTLSNGQTIDAGSVIGSQPTHSDSSFADIVPQVEPKIVRIDVTLRGGIASGSGTIIDNRGYIITNAHVINGGQSIKVTLKDGTVFSATVIKSDTNRDLAIIKLDTTHSDFPIMTLGTMADVLVGEAVMVVGFPGGIDLPGPATFTVGVVSALRTYSGSDFIQIDAAVNPGNSGGCLVALNGKMIGIPTAGLTPPNEDFEDINLAIPINQVTAFITQYVK